MILLIPDFNDSYDEITRLPSFIASVSPNISWQATAIHSTYQITDRNNTAADTLSRDASIRRSLGLGFVAAGDRPVDVDVLKHTRWTSCQTPAIERFEDKILSSRLTAGSHYPSCGTSIHGRRDTSFSGQHPTTTCCRSGLI
jgi:hypothetical protein